MIPGYATVMAASANDRRDLFVGAGATANNNRSLDSLKLGRSNTTTPSALAPGPSLREVIQ
jgi:hypothetical protein